MSRDVAKTRRRGKLWRLDRKRLHPQRIRTGRTAHRQVVSNPGASTANHQSWITLNLIVLPLVCVYFFAINSNLVVGHFEKNICDMASYGRLTAHTNFGIYFPRISLIHGLILSYFWNISVLLPIGHHRREPCILASALHFILHAKPLPTYILIIHQFIELTASPVLFSPPIVLLNHPSYTYNPPHSWNITSHYYAGHITIWARN